ncbi:MAG: helicase-associated domain-containing protein [Actinobacteria bacterium]|nr:helicase-associated domain-containing protein [Actinomycetota bacterium]
MSGTSDERALATALAALPDDGIAEIFAARGVSAASNWHDFFDAAAALLDPASVDRALAALTRFELMALRDAIAASTVVADAVVRDTLRRRGLMGEDGQPFTIVSTRLNVAIAANPTAFDPHTVAEPAQPSSEAAAAEAAERALTAVAALTDVIVASVDSPLTTTATGAVSAVDRRGFIETGVVADAEELDDLVAAAADAGLIAASERQWLVTTEGEQWLHGTSPAKWETVAAAFWQRVPHGVRMPEGDVAPLSGWAQAYPLDTAWPDRATTLQRRARRWGLVTADGAEPPWTRSARTGGPPDTAALVSLIPAEIDRVYLQADLTAISPGPLLPGLDLRLRSMAHRESRAQASTYRFSADSLGTAVALGETADSIREFLSEISLTGIPQPLEYLIDRTAARHGLVRVGVDEASGNTRVHSDDAQLIDTIAVDQALRAIGLVHSTGSLVSRVPRDAVYWALADARYPVIAIDADGAPEPLRRRRGVRGGMSTLTDAQTYAELIATLRASKDSGSDAAWLERELDQAVRARSAVTVVVRLPDGSTRGFTLDATGLGGGRLRGRDRGADVERTLPLSSIVSVHPA